MSKRIIYTLISALAFLAFSMPHTNADDLSNPSAQYSLSDNQSIEDSLPATPFRPEDFIWSWCTDPGPWNEIGSIVVFNPDGTYSYREDPEWATDERLVSMNGVWEIVDGNMLRVTITSRTDHIGGDIIYDPNVVGSYIRGGELQTTAITPEMVREYGIDDLHPLYDISDRNSPKLGSIYIEGRRFWKRSDEPIGEEE